MTLLLMMSIYIIDMVVASLSDILQINIEKHIMSSSFHSSPRSQGCLPLGVRVWVVGTGVFRFDRIEFCIQLSCLSGLSTWYLRGVDIKQQLHRTCISEHGDLQCNVNTPSIIQGALEAKADAALEFVKHQKGFLPGVPMDEPRVVKIRIIHNVEDVTPSVSLNHCYLSNENILQNSHFFPKVRILN